MDIQVDKERAWYSVKHRPELFVALVLITMLLFYLKAKPIAIVKNTNRYGKWSKYPPYAGIREMRNSPASPNQACIPAMEPPK